LGILITVLVHFSIYILIPISFCFQRYNTQFSFFKTATNNYHSRFVLVIKNSIGCHAQWSGWFNHLSMACITYYTLNVTYGRILILLMSIVTAKYVWCIKQCSQSNHSDYKVHESEVDVWIVTAKCLGIIDGTSVSLVVAEIGQGGGWLNIRSPAVPEADHSVLETPWPQLCTCSRPIMVHASSGGLQRRQWCGRSVGTRTPDEL